MAKLRFGVYGAAALVAAACLPVGAGRAATITETYDFSASGFQSGSPVDPWFGAFTITYDPAHSGSLGPLALDAFSSSLPAGYGTFVFAQNGDLITIGDNCGPGACVINGGFDEAAFAFTVDASGNPTPKGSDISGTGAPRIFGTSNLSVTPTPLPATLPLLITGLGSLGLLGWRRKRKVAALAA